MTEASKCPNCGEPIGPDVVVCTNCGTNVKTGEHFGTKVEKEKKKKKKKTGQSSSIAVIVAIVAVIGGIVMFNQNEAKKEKARTECLKSIAEWRKQAQGELEKGEPKQAAQRLNDLIMEIDGHIEGDFSADAKFVEVLKAKEDEVKKQRLKILDIIQKKKEEEERIAREKAQRAKMTRAGLELFQGKWLKPAQIRAMGYRKIDGQWLSTQDLLARGWAFIRGEYRSPAELYGMGYRPFEGTWRETDYIRQVKGDVKVKGKWRTEDEVLPTMPCRLITRTQPEGKIAYVIQNPDGSIEARQPYMKPIPNMLQVLRRTRLQFSRPKNDKPRTRGRPMLSPGTRLTKQSKVGEWYRVVVGEAKVGKAARRGWVAAGDVKVAEEPAVKEIKYAKSMMGPMKVKVEPLTADFKKALDQMRTCKDPNALLQMAQRWQSNEMLSYWPNHQWKAQRCRDMAEIIKNGKQVATPAQADAALAAPVPQALKAVAAPQAKPQPVRQPQAKAVPAPKSKAIPKPMGTIVVTAEKVSVVHGKKGEPPVAVVNKGAKLPYYKLVKNWYQVAVQTKDGLKYGWVPARDVRLPGAPPPPPATAAKPVEKMVAVTAAKATVYVLKAGKWVAAMTLKKGEKIRVITDRKNRYEKTHYLVEATVNGMKVPAYISKKLAH